MNRLSLLLSVIAGAIAGGVIAAAVAGGNGSSHATITTTVTRATQQAQGQPAIPTSFTKGSGMTINQIFRQDGPGVVDITVTTTTPSLFGDQQSTGEGAGVVYDMDGDILTDEHVVNGASTATVKFEDGYVAQAKVIGTDASTDVGVIRVNVPASELHPIAFANSADAQVGDSVVAIGSPFSEPETVTAGIVSATGRSIQAPNQFTISGAIQTDAAINPGNSGGPLLDAEGHVLGLNDQIQTNSGTSSGVGFAIPANTVASVANEIIGGKPIRHPYVGVDLNPNSVGGAQIATSDDAQGNPPIRPGSPAARAGLKAGDLITAIDGQAISSTDQFIGTINQFSPGETITLTVKRSGATKRIKLTLTNRPNLPATSG